MSIAVELIGESRDNILILKEVEERMSKRNVIFISITDKSNLRDEVPRNCYAVTH